MNSFRDIFSKENLTAKLGVLPVWAWGLILGLVVVFVYYVFLRKKNTTTLTTATDKTTDENQTASDDLASSFDNLYTALTTPATSTTPATPTGSTVSGGGGGASSYRQNSLGVQPKSITTTPLTTPASVGTIADSRRTSGGSFAPTAPANPTTQTHIPVSPGQKIADTTTQSGTPKPKPKATPVYTIPKVSTITPTTGKKVAF